MRQFLAGTSNCVAALVGALLAIFLLPLSADVVLSDSSGSDASAPAAPSTPACSSHEPVVYQSNPSPGSESDCGMPRAAAEVADARAYLIETASPGYTMTLQSPELAIGRLHPEFAVRLEHAIREARSAGLPLAGVFSAYRPPAFGVGGFSDKFNSLHTYGLAVDMRGIGSPGSSEAQLWHEIAAKNGVVCPYGPRDRAEWNHCQPTSIKIILAENPLRDTVSSAGPFDLESMFEAGNALIEDMASAADSLSRAAAAPVRILEAAASGRKSTPQPATSHRAKQNSRAAIGRLAAKPVRHAKLGHRVGGTPIIAVEEGRRKSTAIGRLAAKSVRHAKLGHRVGGTPIIAVEEGRRKPTAIGRLAAKSVRPAKPRHRLGGTPVIAVEEGRRKSKAGRA
jgi:hypothetical protein